MHAHLNGKILLVIAMMVSVLGVAQEAQWEEWLLRSASRVSASAQKFYNGSRGEFYSELRNIELALKPFPKNISPDLKKRIMRLRNYAEEVLLETKPGHGLGFRVPDAQYFEETSQFTSIPDFLLTSEFLKLVSSAETLEQAKAILAKQNEKRPLDQQLTYFSYRSRHLGTPDSPQSFGRLLIVVPGNPVKWVQFGVPDPGRGFTVRNVSVVSVYTKPNGEKVTYLKDHFRTFENKKVKYIRSRFEETNTSDNCVSCHKSGILPIFPVKDSVPVEELERVKQVNKMFKSYGPPNFGSEYVDISRFGPGLGDASRETLRNRLEENFSSEQIRSAMNCGACHSHNSLGAMSFPFDRTILQSYILSGEMPPKTKLNESDLRLLHDYLLKEYFNTSSNRPGVFVRWLAGMDLEKNCANLLLDN